MQLHINKDETKSEYCMYSYVVIFEWKNWLSEIFETIFLKTKQGYS